MIKYVKGDLFQLTKTTLNKPLLLAHACNCLGIWGGGIASAFKTRYFSSYELYHTHCHSFNSPSELLGTSLILPVSTNDSGFVNGLTDNLLVVCLFTSVIGQDSDIEIAQNTKFALLDLKQKLQKPELIENEIARTIITDYNKQICDSNGNIDISKYLVNMPKINAGIFGVNWELTEKALKQSNLNCQVFEL
jgi:ADP-ribose 1''-phosphate phosphatase